MKDFMMIFHGEDYTSQGLSPEQIQERMMRWFAWQEKMTKNGREPRGNALYSKGLTISGKDRIVTDGPFVEGKELIGGYYIIKAKDLEDALEVSKDYPEFDSGGTVDIREVMVYN